MAYSRWSNSYWYTYWFASESKYMDEQLFSCDGISVFTFVELKKNINGCLTKVKSLINNNKNLERFPSEKEYEELKGYMERFVSDVETDERLVKKEFQFDPEAQEIIDKGW